MASISSAGERLDRLPVFSFHRRLLLVIGLGVLFDTFDLAMQGSVLGALIHDGWSTMALNATFISSTFAGTTIGAFACGFLGDRYGRRFTYQFNLLVFGLASLVAAFATSMPWLIALRGIMGIGIGAEYVVAYSMISEFVPPQHRGRYMAIVGVVSMSAGTLSSGTAYFVIPYLTWRAMFVIAGLGAMFVWYLRKELPESPRWLEANGFVKESDAVLSVIEAAAIAETNQPLRPVPTIVTQPAATPSFSILFTPGVLRRTLLFAFINITVFAGNYGFSAWVPTFLVKQGFDLNHSLGFYTIMQFGGIVGPAMAYWIADGLGRRMALVLSALVAAGAGIGYGFAQSEAMLLLMGFFTVGSILLLLTISLAIYGPELFPTEYRMRANGFGQAVGRLTTIAIPQITVVLFAHFGVFGVIGTSAALFVLLAFAVLLFGIETRGKSLEALAPESETPIQLAESKL